MVQASRKNLANIPAPAAAAFPPAATSTNAAAACQGRPALVHPPNQQPPDPCDVTPNPKRRRQEKKGPGLGPAQLQQQQLRLQPRPRRRRQRSLNSGQKLQQRKGSQLVIFSLQRSPVVLRRLNIQPKDHQRISKGSWNRQTLR